MRKGDFLFFAQKMIIYNQSTCAPLPFFNTRFDKLLRLLKCITSVKMHYVCQNALRLSKCITSVEMHYVCRNALRLSKFCRNNYGYVNSDSALLPYISAFYKSNSRRSIMCIVLSDGAS